MSLVLNNTPWEDYKVDGVTVHVKREDLCCPDPGPSFSKVRGLAVHLEYECGKRSNPVVGVMDTLHSKAGWGAAWICQQLGVRCIDFYPVLKSDNGQVRPNQLKAEALGAEIHPMQPLNKIINGKPRLLQLKSAVLWARARRMLEETYGPDAVMLPNALKLEEAYASNATEAEKYTPDKLKCGSWVYSISSGTIAAGVIRGLRDFPIEHWLHMGYGRGIDPAWNYVVNKSGWEPKVHCKNEGYSYKDKVDNSWIPFPCNEYYDAKAFDWLVRNIRFLRQPVVFWNVGA